MGNGVYAGIMKLRYWIVGLLLCFVVGTWAAVELPAGDEYTKLDMVDINERYDNVVDALEESSINDNLRSQLEEQYRCKIYLVTDEDYETNRNNAIKRQDVLLDYSMKVVDESTRNMENGIDFNGGGTVQNQVLAGKIAFSGQQENVDRLYSALIRRIILIFACLFFAIIILIILMYEQYMRPFHKLQEFAGQISKGNFDFPLDMNKNNYFGAFTESFDVMREELKRARQSEYEANQSKKELVASLSHDIKTPVATIKALCEILEIKVTSEAENEKIHVIEQKADVIDHLISDMFHATLEDLEKLKIVPTEELSTIIQPMFQEINHYGKIHLMNQVPECMICVDKLRLNQVIDNLINNSYKYAGTDIDVNFEKIGHELIVRIQDHGPGINTDELPLLVEKFYRGENAKGKDGSGLGLYLSKTFMEGMGGSMSVENNEGFCVTLTISLVH